MPKIKREDYNREQALLAARSGHKDHVNKWLKEHPSRIYQFVEPNHNILDVAALAGHKHLVRMIVDVYSGRPNKQVAENPALTERVREALKGVPYAPLMNPATGQLYQLKDELFKWVCFEETFVEKQEDLSVLKAMAELDPNLFTTSIYYTTHRRVHVDMTALDYAVKHCSVGVVELALQNSQATPPKAGALVLAAGANAPVLNYLVANLNKLDTKDSEADKKDFSEALAKVLTSGHNPAVKLEAVKALLKLPMDTNFVYQNSNLVELALRHFPQALPEMCKHAKFDINARNANGQTLLHLMGDDYGFARDLSVKDQLARLQILFDLNINASVRDKNGLTPLAYAHTMSKYIVADRILNYLQALTADTNSKDGIQIVNVQQSPAAGAIPLAEQLASIKAEFGPIYALSALVSTYDDYLNHLIEKFSKLRDGYNAFAQRYYSIQREADLVGDIVQVNIKLKQLLEKRNELNRLSVRDIPGAIKFVRELAPQLVVDVNTQRYTEKWLNDLALGTAYGPGFNWDFYYPAKLAEAREKVKDVATKLAGVMESSHEAETTIRFRSPSEQAKPLFDELAKLADKDACPSMVYQMALDTILKNISAEKDLQAELKEKAKPSLAASLHLAGGSPMYSTRSSSSASSSASSSSESSRPYHGVRRHP